MKQDQEPKFSVEASLQAKFEKIFKSDRDNRSKNVLLQNGFVFYPPMDSNSDGDFQVVANSVTGETIIGMLEAGKMSKKLLGYVDHGDLIQARKEVALLLTGMARVLTTACFRNIAKDLGVAEANNLKLYTLKDPRDIVEKCLDALK
jgi:hypothetical protein